MNLHKRVCDRCRVVVLEDNDVVHCRQGAWGIFNAKTANRHTAVPRALETLDMEVTNIMKGGCVASASYHSLTSCLTHLRHVDAGVVLQVKDFGSNMVSTDPFFQRFDSRNYILLPKSFRCVAVDRYDHFMQKEIHEQPDSILQTMRGRVAFGRKPIEEKVSAHLLETRFDRLVPEEAQPSAAVHHDLS